MATISFPSKIAVTYKEKEAIFSWKRRAIFQGQCSFVIFLDLLGCVKILVANSLGGGGQFYREQLSLGVIIWGAIFQGALTWGIILQGAISQGEILVPHQEKHTITLAHTGTQHFCFYQRQEKMQQNLVEK